MPTFQEMTKTGEIMMGINYGVLLMAGGVAGILGPLLGGRAYIATGEYRLAFYIAATLSLAALAILSIAESSTTRELPGTG
jgi:MFS family permease